MKIGMRRLQLFILLFAASSLLFQLPPEVFASTPSDITATDSETDGVNSFDALRDAKAVSTFVIGSSTYAIVVSNDGVQIIDISDPTSIVAKDNVDEGDTDSNGNTFTELDTPTSVDTFVIGSSTYAIIGDRDSGDVQIIDISDPTDILATDTATDGTDGFECLAQVRSVATFVIGSSTYAIVGTHGVAISGSGGVQMIDVSDPAAIVAKDNICNPEGDNLTAYSIDTYTIDSSTYAVIASLVEGSVQIIDISNPAAIVAKDKVTDGDTDSNGDTFDKLSKPVGIATFVIGSSTYAIIVSTTFDTVQIIDISNPAAIVAKDTATHGVNGFELDGAKGVDTFVIGSKTYAIVASEMGDTVQIIDISDPAAIVAKGTATHGAVFEELDGAKGVDTFVIDSNTYAIVTSAEADGVQIIELNTDTTSPTVTITSSSGDSGDAVGDTTLSYTVTFNESTSNFVVGDITVTGTANGGSPAASNFAGSGTTYTFDVVQGSSDGTVSVSVAAGAATDTAGNDNVVSNTYTFTIDTVGPTVTITSSVGDSGSSISAITLSYTATFSESMTGFTIDDITVSGSANAIASNFAGSGTTYTFDVVKNTSDGDVDVKIGSSVATDSGGNSNVASNTYSFSPVTFTSGASTSTSTCSRHVILGNCGTIAINNDEYRIIDTWTNVPTTEVLVGQPVTVTLSTPNNPTHTKIHFASVHTEVFSIPANFDQSVYIDYSVLSGNHHVSDHVSQSQLFQVAGATHRIVQDPDVKNLEMFEVVFTMIFAKPMDTSHVVVETKNKHGIPETLHLLDALKVNKNLPQALTLEEKSKFSIVEPEMDPEPEIEMDPEPEQTKKEKSKRQRR